MMRISRPLPAKSVLVLAALLAALSWPSAGSGEVLSFGSNTSGQGNVPPLGNDVVAIAGGYAHNLVLLRDGSIVAWGRNYDGQCNVPAPNRDFIAVAGGTAYSLGLLSTGSMVAWGSNSDGQCNVPAPNRDFIAISAGITHGLGLKSDGSIVAWGNNTYGQCDVPSPNAHFVAVAGGYAYSLGLKSDGTIVAWGYNGNGACSVPEPNAGFVAISCGSTSLGLRSDGSIAAWGRNDHGQCFVPSPNNDFIAIAGGDSHCLGLKSNGAIVGWGQAASDGRTIAPSPNSGYKAIAIGDGHSLALRVNDGDGVIMPWGNNTYGQCNVPTTTTDFVAIASGDLFGLGLRPDGSITGWGANPYNNTVAPAPNASFVQIAAGEVHSLGLKSDGSVRAWGGNAWGECSIPPGNTGYAAVATPEHTSLGLKANGSVVVWGYTANGQSLVPAPNTQFKAVTGGTYHCLGLKDDGSIVAWGANADGQCNVPPPNSGFISVAAGNYHSLGLRSDGSIAAWGRNSSGQCNVPTPNSGFIALGDGDGDYSVALRSDGTLVAWGINDYGQLNLPEPNLDFTAVASGVAHGFALGRSVTEGVRVTAPGAVAGELYDSPGEVTVRWEYSGTVAPHHYRLEYQTEAGTQPWRFIYDDSTSTSATMEHRWSTPPIGADDLHVRVMAMSAAGDTLAMDTSTYPVVLANKYGVNFKFVHFVGGAGRQYSPSETKAVITWAPNAQAQSYLVDVTLRGKTTCGEPVDRVVDGLQQVHVERMANGILPTWLAIGGEQLAGMPIARYGVTVTAVLAGDVHVPVTTAGDLIICKLEDHANSHDAATMAARTPVLLVHGWTSNAVAWYAAGQSKLIEELAKAESSHHAFSLEYPNIDWIRVSGCAIGESVRYLCSLSGYESVSLLAHSMGGLVCRAYLQNAADPPNNLDTYEPFRHDVDKLMTLSTPHLGAWGDGPVAHFRDSRNDCAGAASSGSIEDLHDNGGFIQDISRNGHLPSGIDYFFTAGTDGAGENWNQATRPLLRSRYFRCKYGSDGVIEVCSATGGFCDGVFGYSLDTSGLEIRYRHYQLGHNYGMAWPGMNEGLSEERARDSQQLLVDILGFLASGTHAISSDDCSSNTHHEALAFEISGRDELPGQWLLSGVQILLQHLEETNPEIGLPIQTDGSGRAYVSLLPGAYRATISAPGFQGATVPFNLQHGGGGFTWPLELMAAAGFVGPRNPTVRINEGASATDNLTVGVALACENAVSYRLAEEPYLEDVPWNPMEATASFELQPGAGTRYLFAQFRSGSGIESPIVSDDIVVGTADLGAITVVSTAKTNARIILDFVDTGRRTPAVFDSLSPGYHYISLDEPGFESDTPLQVVGLTTGAAATVSFNVAPAPPPPPVDGASLGASDYWTGRPVRWNRPAGTGSDMIFYNANLAFAATGDSTVWSLGAMADTSLVLPDALPDSTDYVLRVATQSGRGVAQEGEPATRQFHLDRTAPELSLSMATARDTVEYGQQLMIRMEARDWGGMDRLRLLAVADSNAATADTLYSGAWCDSVPWQVTSGWASRWVRLRLEGYDRAGNVGVVQAARALFIHNPLSGTGDPGQARFWLSAPRANPFSSGTTLEFYLPESEPVQFAIYDLAGRRTRTIVDGRLPAGSHLVHWDGRDDRGRQVASGVYIGRLQAGPHLEIRRMTLVR